MMMMGWKNNAGKEKKEKQIHSNRALKLNRNSSRIVSEMSDIIVRSFPLAEELKVWILFYIMQCTISS